MNTNKSQETSQSQVIFIMESQLQLTVCQIILDQFQINTTQNYTNTKEQFLIYLLTLQHIQTLVQKQQLLLEQLMILLVVVDYVEGVFWYTETILRKVLQEKIKPILMINEIGSLYWNYKMIVKKCIRNSLLQLIIYIQIMFQYALDQEKNLGLFDVLNLLLSIQKNSNVVPPKLQEKFWGDNYFIVVSKCWWKKSNDDSGKQLQSAFTAFIIDQSVNWLIQSQKEIANKMFYILGLELTQEEQKLSGKFLLKAVMSKWINMADTLIKMIICHLPSSEEAKKFRTSFFQITQKKLKFDFLLLVEFYRQHKYKIIDQNNGSKLQAREDRRFI
ncbi:unnamed protein product [Paramecium primaurelia]|uniref:Uncharacterized protein n=1 Tax=Paramecium primaurelia TaxID=5886 RepID=A0A8S1MP36_PARPR|nr:unnamed protein product [Paramecium primaurelia]